MDNQFTYDVTNEKKNASIVPTNTPVDVPAALHNSTTHNNSSPQNAVGHDIQPAPAAAASSSSSHSTGLHVDYDYCFKIKLIGASGVGKTSIFNRYSGQAFSDNIAPSTDIKNIIQKLSIENKDIRLVVYDSPSNFYRDDKRIRNPNCIIFVVDITNRQSFEEIKEFAKRGPDYLPAILVVNKCDLKDQIVVSREEILKAATSAGFKEIIEVSAKTGQNIQLVFQRAAFYTLQYMQNKYNNNSTSDESQLIAPLANLNLNSSSTFFSNNQRSQSSAPVSSSSSSSQKQPNPQQYLFRIKIFGDQAVGKTSIIHCYLNKPIKNDQFSKSFVSHYEKKLVRGDATLRVQLFDWPTNYKDPENRFWGEHARVIIFDMTDRNSFNNINKYVTKADCSHDVFILAGTKKDLAQNIISQEEVYRKAKELGIKLVMFVNGKTGDNVAELFEGTIKLISQNLNIDFTSRSVNPEPQQSRCVIS